ncbi:thiazolylpeptide-type bacteriocin [Nocardia nova]
MEDLIDFSQIEMIDFDDAVSIPDMSASQGWVCCSSSSSSSCC